MKNILFIIFLGLFLSGCGVGGAYLTTDKERYRNYSQSKLCIAYYRAVVLGNIHAPSMREMIDERGLDCAPYKEEGMMLGQADKEFVENTKENLKDSDSGKKRTHCRTTNVGGVVQVFCNEY